MHFNTYMHVLVAMYVLEQVCVHKFILQCFYFLNRYFLFAYIDCPALFKVLHLLLAVTGVIGIVHFYTCMTLLWLYVFLCVHLLLFSIPDFPSWVLRKMKVHMFFPSWSPCHPLFLLFFLFFSLSVSLPFSVENVASPKPSLLQSKSPKIKSNPTLLFYSVLSHSSSLSFCFSLPFPAKLLQPAQRTEAWVWSKSFVC